MGSAEGPLFGSVGQARTTLDLQQKRSGAVPHRAKVPQVDIENKRLLQMVKLLGDLVAEQCEPDASFTEVSKQAVEVMANVMWFFEELRLQAAVTNDPRIVVDGEPYRRLSQPSSAVVHGLWGAHVIEEPLYRRQGVRSGPTVKPLEKVLGLVQRNLLPSLASAAGSLMACMTSREAEAMLRRLGLRPPSRAVLETRVGAMLEDISVEIREVEQEVRDQETLDFEVGAISCGMDRMAVRMDETLPEGPLRDAKLEARKDRSYQRTPPEPYVTAWRMAWTANVTLYDVEGKPRRTLRYGAAPSGDPGQLAERVVDELLDTVETHRQATVLCIQDGAADLDVLRGCLRERLPEGVRREHLVDFHHAIVYLDAVVSSLEPEGDPCGMREWYRDKLLHCDRGVDDILRHLRRYRRGLPDGHKCEALDDAIRYLGKRRMMMGYAALVREGLPIGSGATESGCALQQLRVKHPGSHWRPRGLHAVMTARVLSLSSRWDSAFPVHHRTLKGEVAAQA